MFDDFFEKIDLFVREFLANGIISIMNALTNDLNSKVGEIGTEIAKGPDTWNSGVFSLIRTLSDNVILPIAGMILTYVVVYELYHMAVDQNNMKEFGPNDMFKFLFKNSIAVMILTNTTDIVMAIFDVGNYIVGQASGVIMSNAQISLGDYESLFDTLVQYEVYQLVGMIVEAGLIYAMVMVLSIVIMVILYGRMIEIYLYISVAPIPFAAFMNRDLSSVSQNYVKGLVGIAFQGFFIILCVGIYAKLVQGITGGSDIHETLFQVAACTLVLLFTLLRSGQISKSIFGAH